MSLPILRGFTLVVDDDQNLVLEIESLQLPPLEEITEDFQPGGSDLQIQVAGLGVKALESPFKLKSHSPGVTGLFGGPPGVRRTFTGKKFVVDELDGTEHEHAIDMTGRLISIAEEEMSGGKASGYDHKIGSILNYSYMADGKVLHRFNFQSGGWMVRNGVPVNEGRRRVLFS
ncbi:phage major tail tube protein [Stappia stellulata]|uniref:phage major tail tube protein n=1 Tax=Stappia stellulata TaxID=71235 RepID=UPI001CD339AA|nr:phage major tail tube protein [Stappia stellulata]MCA1242936.1 phage major tail tube protein [Stappia stellulata]